MSVYSVFILVELSLRIEFSSDHSNFIRCFVHSIGH